MLAPKILYYRVPLLGFIHLIYLFREVFLNMNMIMSIWANGNACLPCEVHFPPISNNGGLPLKKRQKYHYSIYFQKPLYLFIISLKWLRNNLKFGPVKVPTNLCTLSYKTKVWPVWGLKIQTTQLALTQDRRGHMKPPKFGQCCSQISEFISSFSQLSVCRHGL